MGLSGQSAVTRALRRVASMDANEVSFRGRDYARTLVEAARYSRAVGWKRQVLRSRLRSTSPELIEVQRALVRGDELSAAAALRSHLLQRAPRFPIAPTSRRSIAASILGQFPAAADAARRRGDRILEGYRDLLGYPELHVGSGARIDWHYDPVHDLRAPVRFWSKVPYLNPHGGDHKIIWELNRHQHWLALGRAAWLTGDRRYAAEFRAELGGWLSANPPLSGINWSSMLELGFRTISWLWSAHFFAGLDDESTDGTWLLDLFVALDAQLNHISRHLSRYFSPNTHLLGEGLALYAGGRVFPELAGARSWAEIGREILLAERSRQVNRDGGHAELSAHYHRYALDFYLFALTIARATDDSCANALADAASRLATFCRAIVDDSGFVPTIGDDDGGMLFPIAGRACADVTDSLSLAAALLERPDLAIGDPPEETLWMLGGDRHRLRWPDNSHVQASQLFPDTGYAVLRSPQAHIIVDVGRHGFLNGGHAHADALSVVMSIQGRPFLVDPGTCTYTMDPERRNLFRSTVMHNTLTADGRPQSIPGSPFHWKSVANARVRLWRSGPGFDAIEGEHDGYLPEVHRRAIVRHGPDLWLVADHLLGEGDHRVDIRWHLNPAWRLTSIADGTVSVEHRDSTPARVASTGSQTTPAEGGEVGWYAAVYGQQVPALTITVSEHGHAPLSVVTAIAAGFAAPKLAVELAEVRTDKSDGRHRVAVVGSHGDARFIALFSTESGASTDQPQPVQTVPIDGIEFHTDAQIAVLGLSSTLEPIGLTLIGATQARWMGPGGFEFQSHTSAADLHLNRSAVSRLSRNGQRSPSNKDSMERIICAE